MRRAAQSSFDNFAFHCNIICPGKTAGFLSFITFQVPFTIVVKAFQAALEFINAHLQQCDQVTSVLRTVDFWLIVC